MFCELWLAQRYLRAGKKERIISLTAFISVIGIAVGVMVLIVVIAVMSGFDRYLQDKMTGTYAHMILEFYSGNKQPYITIEELKKIPHIQAASPFIAGEAFLKIDSRITSVDIQGIDSNLQPQVSKIREYLKKGSLDLEGKEVILGEELALRVNAGLGDTLKLVSPATLTETLFKVKGIFNSGMYLYDSGFLMTSIKAAQDFFKIGNQVSGIAVKVDDVYKVEEIKKDIYAKLSNIGQYQVRTWVDLNKNFLNALKLEKMVMFIVVTMTTVVAAFGIVNTLIMSVMSKIKDIGILRSIGAKTRSVLSIFVFQGLVLGISGIVLGLIGGISLALSLNKIIDFISGAIGRSLIPKDIYYFDRIPVNFNSSDIALIIFCAFVISLLASIYPAYYAANINPAEALRNE